VRTAASLPELGFAGIEVIMPIEFRCTQCNRLLRTADGTEGKQAKCPQCGAVLTVPAPQTGQPGSPPPYGPQAGSPFTPGADSAPTQPSVENPYESPTGYGQPQQYPFGGPTYPRGYVPNYLVQAILCTLFCCLPFGIVAIIFAAQVNSHLAGGNYEAALSASQSARTWCWVSFWFGIIPTLLWFLLMVAGTVAGM
jgi:phage FluMu protein Com